MRETDYTEEPCWPWPGSRHPKGYGWFWVRGRNLLAHRWAYERFVGPIPEDMLVLHRCDNPPCFNPAHLFLGSAIDNNADMTAKGRRAIGSRHGKAKVSEDDVREIRRRHGGGESALALGRAYAISNQAVASIVKRVTWQHVE